MAVLVNYISELLKEDKGLRKEMNRIYKWCKKHHMTDNTSVIIACIAEVLKYAIAIAITAVVSLSMLIAVLLMV